MPSTEDSRFRFEPSTDYELIRSIIAEPRVYERMTDDFSPAREDYRPPDNPAVLYLLGYENDKLLGLWAFVPQNAICWEVHAALLPHAWGKTAAHAFQAMFAWIWANTGCRRLVAHIPNVNRAALLFARRAGMQVIGINRNSFQRNGKLHDQTFLGLSRPEV